MQVKNLKSYNKVFGVVGEKIACEYLKKLGYNIIEKNYQNFLGEIDIICNKKIGKEYLYVFVEVKYRNSKQFGFPREAVIKKKQLNIRKVAMSYLKLNGLYDKVFVRFDCVEILNGVEDNKPRIELLENAF